MKANPASLNPPSPPDSATAALPAIFLRRRGRPRVHPVRDTAFGCPRDYLDNRFVYLVVTPRVHGLLAGINVAADKRCNFDCLYCEVDRTIPPQEPCVDIAAMEVELERTLQFVRSGRLRERPAFHALPKDLFHVHHVALAGDGEPTLCPYLAGIAEAVAHVRAQGNVPYFKLILVTNASLLHLHHAQDALRFFTRDDDIWLKLDAGTPPWMKRINRTEVSLQRVLDNILLIARERPAVIQSMFPAINGEEPPMAEINEYAQRLCELRTAGAQIRLVQICSATRPNAKSPCSHLGLRVLSRIAYQVRQVTGLNVEVC